MKKQLLLLLLVPVLFIGCSKKSDDELALAKPKSLTGMKFESYWFTASGGERYYYRLNFKSDTQVDYFVTYINDTFITGDGTATLTYTIDDPNKSFPNIHITGTLNGSGGTPGKGEKVDYILSYTPALGDAKASLSTTGKYYTQY